MPCCHKAFVKFGNFNFDYTMKYFSCNTKIEKPLL